MNFEIHKIQVWRSDRRIDFSKDFWKTCVGKEDHDLPSACGCYMFALENGGNFVPWYVGKTEKLSFQVECSSKNHFFNSEITYEHNGTPYLFLIPRLTASGKKFSKPTKGKLPDVDALETMLIGMALKKNKHLLNVKKTALLREIKVPGIINSSQARPTSSESALRNALGLTSN